MDNENDNITFRLKHQILKANSFDGTEGDCSTSSICDYSMRSLPSVTDRDSVDECREKITQLEIKLSSAEEEIENLNIQNSELKHQIERSSRVITLYKKIGITENSMSSISSPIIHRIKKVINTPSRSLRLTSDQSTQTNDDSSVLTENVDKIGLTRKYKLRLRRQRRKIKNLINRIRKLKIQNQKLTEELENLYITNFEEYEELITTSDSEHSVTFVKEDDKLSHDTILKPEINLPKHDSEQTVDDRHSLDGERGRCTKSTTCNGKSKVVILADQTGRGVRQLLQHLLGSKYDVFCFWKPGGRLADLLNSCISDIPSLSMTDYVVVLGFANDDSLSHTRNHLLSWIECTKNTNIIICECSSNNFLKENRLNNELCKISEQFSNTTYLDMNFKLYKPRPNQFSLYISRYILREILRLYYISQRQLLYCNLTNNNNCSLNVCNKTILDVKTDTELCTYVEKGTQTDNMTTETNCTSTDTDIQHSNFFRI